MKLLPAYWVRAWPWNTGSFISVFLSVKKNPAIPIDKSYKIDYVAISEKAGKAVLVELKTEGHSRRPEQG